ncbi:MAG: hypothetical protein P8164_07740 [Gammaproteobacteria bacterium]|jgi:hypothetical protein
MAVEYDHKATGAAADVTEFYVEDEEILDVPQFFIEKEHILEVPQIFIETEDREPEYKGSTQADAKGRKR